ncbi:ribonuclease H-like domain-containing protein [Desulforhopalus sp. 52FAK]
MLRHTFSHIPGIGPKIEKNLWSAGISSWPEWQIPAPVRISANSNNEAPAIIEASQLALQNNDPTFFTSRLAANESWRIFSQFRDSIAYLDIETTGLDDFAEITTIALYDGKTIFTYVNGQNLGEFVDDICKYKVIVSYNGKSFDVPFIERYFKTRLNHAQIDLRYILAKLGFKGGLKGCERQLGLDRGNLDGVDGYFAVLLWQMYKRTGDERALETLLAYNIEDTVNLERLAVEAYNRNVANTPFAAELSLPWPELPNTYHTASIELVDQLRGYQTY